jgi:hypothetical protein
MSRRQHSEFKQLRRLAIPFRYLTSIDSEGFPVIPGRYGSLEWFDGRDLAVYSDHPRFFAKLWRSPAFAGTRPGTTRCAPSSRPRPSSRWWR